MCAADPKSEVPVRRAPLHGYLKAKGSDPPRRLFRDALAGPSHAVLNLFSCAQKI